MTDNTELLADLRSRINPAYENQRGTESYERKQCADAIEALELQLKNASVAAIAEAAEVDRLKAEVERLKGLYESSTAAHEETVGRAMRAEAQLAAAQPKVKVIAESLYDRTGDIKDFNTVLIGRDALQVLEETCAAQPVQCEVECTCAAKDMPFGRCCKVAQPEPSCARQSMAPNSGICGRCGTGSCTYVESLPNPPVQAQPERAPLSDADCTRIYNEANGITDKNPPISTQRIFAAMRAAAKAKP